ncbi:TAXI family TRAP transporter solute-binding subunit [Microbacterium sp. NPDC055903]
MTRFTRSAAALVTLVMVCVLGACAPRSSEWADADYVIAGGGATGVYFAYGGQLAAALSDSLDAEVRVAETAGSLDNLIRVASGDALFGFAQGDAAADAVAGAGAFEEPLDVTAVARLYDEYVHVVVRGDSDIRTVSDLAGREASLGAANSGVTVIAARVLTAAGVDPRSVRDAQLDLRGSISAMQRGEIEGFFWVGGLPTPGIEDLAADVPLRLLPIEDDWVIDINERYSHSYRSADVPAGVYGLRETTSTMAVPNYLITSASTPDEMVADALSVLFDSRRQLAEEVPAVALLDRRQAIFTEPVDLHPGAIAYFREERQ